MIAALMLTDDCTLGQARKALDDAIDYELTERPSKGLLWGCGTVLRVWVQEAAFQAIRARESSARGQVIQLFPGGAS